MRYGSLCSALLHGAVVALLLVSLPDAGGAPSLGAGDGSVTFEVVSSLPGAAPSQERSAAASETPPEEPPPEATTQVATAVPPPPAEAVPLPASAAPVAEPLELPPVPLGPEPNTPAPASVVAEPPAAPLETVEVSEEALALAEQPVETRDPQRDQGPPEKPLRKVEVPAPQLVKQEAPQEPAPEAVEQASETAVTQPAGAQQAALPGDDSNDTLGSQGAPGAAGGATVGMSAGELQDYAGLLVAWLDKHKRYPDSSRRRKEEGVVMVEFAIDGRGRVLSHRLLDASGHALLDAEATALLARASPVPAPPDGVGRSFQVPVVFALR